MINLAELCEACCLVAASVGRFIRQELGRVEGQQVETKSLNSLVSYVDKQAEEQLVQALSALLPESGFLTEEGTVAEDSSQALRWIIDPLDGTTNFLHQVPIFSISIALQQAGEIVLGVVYEANRQECFYAWKGGGAFLNGQPIRVSGQTQLADSLLATGFPYYDYGHLSAYLRILEYFVQHTRGIRRLGSAAVDLAYTACGRFDGFYEYGLHAWDLAAGVLLVQEAGGKVSDFKGGDDYLFGEELIAASPAIWEDMQACIGQAI
ncbi:MAG TPA: inositol monophosphatase family protein [Saprospiraceae bacterium]|nr:inositol monophosphatase family protein [Saprospiraceae bacterium]HMQ82858.1 inositol monophosphatase family protein [Saprospiraceae bacterium]